MGPSLFASALQLILVAVHRVAWPSATAVAIRTYLDVVSVTSTPLGACSTLTDIATFSKDINLDLNLR